VREYFNLYIFAGKNVCKVSNPQLKIQSLPFIIQHDVSDKSRKTTLLSIRFTDRKKNERKIESVHFFILRFPIAKLESFHS
jgi:hypothetical protein